MSNRGGRGRQTFIELRVTLFKTLDKAKRHQKEHQKYVERLAQCPDYISDFEQLTNVFYNRGYLQQMKVRAHCHFPL